jgi:Metallo-peptidase family M12B Reprolysin-like
MRWPRLLAAVVLSACGGGGGGVPLALEQQVSFGFVRRDMPTAKEILVANPLVADATAEELGGAGGPFAIAPGMAATVGSGGTLAVPVVFTPGAPGTHEGELRLRFAGTDGKRADIRLALVAVVETPLVALREPTLDFPAPMFVGETRTLRAYVENRSHATPVAVTSIGGVPSGFTAFFAPAVLLPGQFASIAVIYAPEEVGVHDFDLPVTHGAGDPLLLRVRARTDEEVPEVIVDFGDVPLVAGMTDWLEVDLLYPAISLSLEALGGDATAQPQLVGLEGPGGYVYKDEAGGGPLQWFQYVQESFALTIPNTDRADSQLVPGGGRYRFRFSCTGASLAVRAIIENRRRTIAEEGVVNLNVFFAGGLGVDPAQDPKIGKVLEGTDAVLGQVGLGLGDVSYFQLDKSDYDIITTTSELRSLLAESSAAPAARLNVFFVQSLFPSPLFGPAAGVAGDVPVPKRNGTQESGVAADYTLDSTFLGLVLAHEIGHALGLFHTTESGGQQDNIEDTAECPANGCTESYLMYWYWLGAEEPVVTPGQARVILGHPLVDPTPGLAGLSSLAQKGVPAPAWFQLPPGFCATCAK